MKVFSFRLCVWFLLTVWFSNERDIQGASTAAPPGKARALAPRAAMSKWAPGLAQLSPTQKLELEKEAKKVKDEQDLEIRSQMAAVRTDLELALHRLKFTEQQHDFSNHVRTVQQSSDQLARFNEIYVSWQGKGTYDSLNQVLGGPPVVLSASLRAQVEALGHSFETQQPKLPEWM